MYNVICLQLLFYRYFSFGDPNQILLARCRTLLRILQQGKILLHVGHQYKSHWLESAYNVNLSNMNTVSALGLDDMTLTMDPAETSEDPTIARKFAPFLSNCSME